jgi:isopenicillin N synthase-like dioxygenase
VPLPTATVSRTFARSARFFARPPPQKEALAWTTPASNRGYVAPGREKVSDSLTRAGVAADRAVPDLKESMEIGRDDEPAFPNRWPDRMDEEGAAFAREMRAFFLQCKELHRLLMSAIALALGLAEDFFDPYVRTGDNTLRLLHYPPVKRDVFVKNKDQVRAGAHTDYGSITLLFQDGRGGLQVQTKDGCWEDVAPIEGTVVVNAGDLLARWSNDRVKSTRHRVVEPPVVEAEMGLDEHPARYSIAYFCNPDFDKQIEALPGTWETTGKKYPGVKSGQYLIDRLTATY